MSKPKMLFSYSLHDTTFIYYDNFVLAVETANKYHNVLQWKYEKSSLWFRLPLSTEWMKDTPTAEKKYLDYVINEAIMSE